MPQLSADTLTQTLGAAISPEPEINTQQVLSLLANLCTQFSDNAEVAEVQQNMLQNNPTLEADIQHLCASHPDTSEHVFLELLAEER